MTGVLSCAGKQRPEACYAMGTCGGLAANGTTQGEGNALALKRVENHKKIPLAAGKGRQWYFFVLRKAPRGKAPKG